MSFFKLYREERILFGILLLTILVGSISSAFAYLVFIPAILFLLKKKKYADILVALLLIIILSDSRRGAFSYAYLIKILSLIITSVFLLYDTRNQSKGHFLFKAFIPFFLLALISLSFSPYPSLSFQKTASYMLLIWAIPHLIIKGMDRDAHNFIRKLVILFFYVLFIGLCLNWIAPEFVHIAGRFHGLLGNPNGMGVFLTISGILLLYIYKTPEYKGVITNQSWLFLAIVFIISLLLCNSRVAIFSLTLFIVFYTFRIGLFFSIIIIFLFGISYQLLISYAEEIVFLFGLEDYLRADTLEEAGGRVIGFDFAWESIQKDWQLIGGGFEYTNYLFKKSFSALAQENHVGNAHNSYLTVWLDVGVFGMIFFVVAWFLNFKKAQNNNSRIYPGMIAILFSSFFESWLAGSLNPYTIILIIFLVIFQNKNNEKL